MKRQKNLKTSKVTYRVLVNRPIAGKVASGVPKRKTRIAKTSKSKLSQRDIKKSLKGNPKGSVAWGMRYRGNDWSKVGHKESK